MMKFPSIQTSIDYNQLRSGLDQSAKALSIYPGAAIDAINYEALTLDGYARIDGYERFDGQVKPSDGFYHYIEINLTGAISVGDTVSGAISGSATVIYVGLGYIAVTKTTGIFLKDDTLEVLGVSQATISVTPTKNGAPTGVLSATILNLVADEYRDDILPVPGSGNILGAVMYKGVVYAFRNNAGATACDLYKSTASGWVKISLYHSLDFTAGTESIPDGTAITQLTSGATATIKRQVLQTGTYAGSNATGRLILDNITGTFNATHAIQVSAATKCTSSSAATQITIAPGGRYEFSLFNFYGSTDTYRMYGCDGVNPAFDFDGDAYIPITTGMIDDSPLHIQTHKKTLFLSFSGSLQSSGVGTPHEWTVLAGANEIGLGDDITGMIEQAGDVLIIFTRNSTWQLSGSTIADFQLDSLAPETGALHYTQNNLGAAFALDDRGVIQIRTSQEFGNFESNTVSRKVQPTIDSYRSKVIATAVYKSRNQIRYYADDGTGFIQTVSDTENGLAHYYTTFKYPNNITCAYSGEDLTGKEVVLLGGDNGYIYQADKGSSFDGTTIEAILRTTFNHFSAPEVLKSYRKAMIEIVSNGYSLIRVHPDFDYGDPEISTHLLVGKEIQGLGGMWNIDNWEQFYYDSKVISAISIPVAGTGTTISFTFYSNSTIDLGHTLQGIVTHYTKRRLTR
jgi:hypothetical protein